MGLVPCLKRHNELCNTFTVSKPFSQLQGLTLPKAQQPLKGGCSRQESAMYENHGQKAAVGNTEQTL